MAGLAYLPPLPRADSQEATIQNLGNTKGVVMKLRIEKVWTLMIVKETPLRDHRVGIA